jgi:branched-chain amino acid transport system ATP-binding protein
VLVVEDLHVYYGEIHALKGVSLSVGDGEIVTLLGPNGAGKTTTVKTISGLLVPRRGRVLLDDAPLTGQPPHAIVYKGVGHVPEGRKIFNRLTVGENLDMGAYSRTDTAVGEDLERVFALFPRLKERAAQVAGTLSGGEQQMLAIGRALMSHPRLLLLDEPSLGLAPRAVRAIMSALQQLRGEGLTILLVEQNAKLALEMTDRAYLMRTGEIVLSDASARLRENDDVVRAYLGMS